MSFKWPWPSKSGGDSLEEAFEQCATSMFGYMTTDYNTVEMKEEIEVEAEGNKKSYITFCLCLHTHTCMLFQYANQFIVLFITNMYKALLKSLLLYVSDIQKGFYFFSSLLCTGLLSHCVILALVTCRQFHPVLNSPRHSCDLRHRYSQCL